MHHSAPNIAGPRVKRRILFLVAVLIVLSAMAGRRAAAGETDLQIKVDWKTFLARHDLVWKAAPTDYSDAPFVGNGLLSAMLYA